MRAASDRDDGAVRWNNAPQVQRFAEALYLKAKHSLNADRQHAVILERQD